MALPSIDVMIATAGSSIPPWIHLVQRFGYFLGVAFLIHSLFKFKAHSENPHQHPLHSALIVFLVGAALVGFMSAIGSVEDTLGFSHGSGSPLAADYGGGGGGNSAMLAAVFAFVSLVGYIAFLRGWLLIKKMGDGREGGDALFRGITHILGGVAAIHVVDVAQMLGITFGLS